MKIRRAEALLIGDDRPSLQALLRTARRHQLRLPPPQWLEHEYDIDDLRRAIGRRWKKELVILQAHRPTTLSAFFAANLPERAIVLLGSNARRIFVASAPGADQHAIAATELLRALGIPACDSVDTLVMALTLHAKGFDLLTSGDMAAASKNVPRNAPRSARTLRRSKNEFTLKDLCAQHGVPLQRSRLVQSASAAAQAARDFKPPLTLEVDPIVPPTSRQHLPIIRLVGNQAALVRQGYRDLWTACHDLYPHLPVKGVRISEGSDS